MVRTGLAMELPSTHGALVEDRSGLAVRGVTTLAGVIDPGYRGELKVVMTNLSTTEQVVAPGHRIAQLRIVRADRGAVRGDGHAGGSAARGGWVRIDGAVDSEPEVHLSLEGERRVGSMGVGTQECGQGMTCD